jgi:hypothetical protein
LTDADTSSTRARIEAGSDGVVARVGLHALDPFADVLWLGAASSARMVPAGERLPLHDRVFVHAMLTRSARRATSPPNTRPQGR